MYVFVLTNIHSFLKKQNAAHTLLLLLLGRSIFEFITDVAPNILNVENEKHQEAKENSK